MKRLIGLLAISSLPFTSSATANVSVRFDPPEGLVGIPPAIVVTVENVALRPVVLPRRFAMVAIAPDRSSFRLGEPFGTDVGTIPDVYGDDELRVPPGETRQFNIPLGGSLLDPGLFGDRRLYSAGRWRFTVIFDDRLVPERKLMEDPAVSVENVLYSVTEGDQRDQNVWAELMARTNGAPLAYLTPAAGLKVASELLEQFPQSRYQADLLIARSAPSYEAAIEMAEKVLALNPRPLLHDRSLLLIADVLQTDAIGQATRPELAEEREGFERALAAFAKARDQARTEVGRRMAERKRAQAEAEMKERFDGSE